MGGNAVLYAVDRGMAAQYFTERFQAAVAYYPACLLPLVTLAAPTLILAGEQDDWTPAERCREMVAHARPDSAPIALHVYPDAHHAFDVAVLHLRQSARGSGACARSGDRRNPAALPRTVDAGCGRPAEEEREDLHGACSACVCGLERSRSSRGSPSRKLSAGGRTMGPAAYGRDRG